MHRISMTSNISVVSCIVSLYSSLILCCYRIFFWNWQGPTCLIDRLEGIQEYPRDWNLHWTVFAANLPTWPECLPYSWWSRNIAAGTTTTGMQLSSHTIHPKQHPARAVLVTIPIHLLTRFSTRFSMYHQYIQHTSTVACRLYLAHKTTGIMNISTVNLELQNGKNKNSSQGNQQQLLCGATGKSDAV